MENTTIGPMDVLNYIMKKDPVGYDCLMPYISTFDWSVKSPLRMYFESLSGKAESDLPSCLLDFIYEYIVSIGRLNIIQFMLREVHNDFIAHLDLSELSEEYINNSVLMSHRKPLYHFIHKVMLFISNSVTDTELRKELTNFWLYSKYAESPTMRTVVINLLHGESIEKAADDYNDQWTVKKIIKQYPQEDIHAKLLEWIRVCDPDAFETHLTYARYGSIDQFNSIRREYTFDELAGLIYHTKQVSVFDERTNPLYDVLVAEYREKYGGLKSIIKPLTLYRFRYTNLNSLNKQCSFALYPMLYGCTREIDLWNDIVMQSYKMLDVNIHDDTPATLGHNNNDLRLDFERHYQYQMPAVRHYIHDGPEMY